MSRQTLHVVAMGVAGCGKTTVAQYLATGLDLEFAEGDDYHPGANVTKMSSGIALTDSDRWPWLESLAAWTEQHKEEGRSTVLTCSALKRAYRDVLRSADPETFFVHLHGEYRLLRERMSKREHFMPAELLQSQFDTLEPLEPDESGVEIDVAPSIPEVVVRAIAAVREHRDAIS